MPGHSTSQRSKIRVVRAPLNAAGTPSLTVPFTSSAAEMSAFNASTWASSPVARSSNSAPAGVGVAPRPVRYNNI